MSLRDRLRAVEAADTPKLYTVTLPDGTTRSKRGLKCRWEWAVVWRYHKGNDHCQASWFTRKALAERFARRIADPARDRPSREVSVKKARVTQCQKGE